MKKFISLVLIFNIIICSSFVYADSFKVVTIGNDLNAEQKQKMMEMFQVKESDAQIINVTNDEEREYLKGIATSSQIGTKSISCAYIEPLSTNSGLKVHTLNLTWVNEEMLTNAMVTAGVKDAKVIAAAPFKVSGTAALTGVMKGFEKATGKELDKDAKDAANMEIITTGNLANEVGNDKAVAVMHEVKQEVVKTKAKTVDDINSIVNKVSEHYGITLSEEHKNDIINTMKKISSLDLKISDISNQLKNIKDKLANIIEQNEEAKGFLQKIYEMVKNMFAKITSIFG